MVGIVYIDTSITRLLRRCQTIDQVGRFRLPIKSANIDNIYVYHVVSPFFIFVYFYLLSGITSLLEEHSS